MKLGSFGALVCASLLGSLANAGSNSWTLTGPEGGSVTAVAVHPADPSVVLASAGNGMYRSADGGLTWARAGVGGWGTEIAFDPQNPNRVFVAAGFVGFYRSDDAGQTFAASLGPANSIPRFIAISGNGTIYILDGDARVFRSSDVGATWVQAASIWPGSVEATAIAVDRAQSNVVYVAVRGVGIFKSTDSGASWGAPLAGSPGTVAAQPSVFQIVIKPDDPNRILAAAIDGAYVSANGGTSWAHPLTAYRWQSIAFDPAANNNVVAFGYLGQVYRSSDGGLTWPADLLGPELRVAESPRVHFAPGNKLIVATSNGPMMSTDGGATFALRATGMRAQGVRSFTTADNGVMFAAFEPGPFGIYRHEGVGWQAVDNVELNSRLSFPGLSHIAVAPGNAQRLYATGGGGLVSSLDGGQSWSSPHPQFSSGDIFRTVVDPTNEQVIYVATQSSGLWKSENGGLTYTRQSPGQSLSVSNVTVDRTNPQVLYASSFTQVYKSADGGSSWVSTGVLPETSVLGIVIDPTNSSVVYAVLTSGIHKSTNRGDTWAPLSLGEPNGPFAARGLVFDPAIPTTMIVTGTPDGPGFSRSVDAGATWQSIRWEVLPPGIGSMDFLSLDSVSPNIVLAGGYNTGLYEYQVANDLRLSPATPLTAALGATGSLTIPYENLGPFHAAAPEIRVVIPSNLTITAPAGCTYTAPNLRCVLAALRSGETRNLVLPYSASATAANGGISVNFVGRELDLVADNNGIGISVTVRAIADLGVTTTAAASAQRGAAVTYTASVTNNGPNPAATATLVVTVPSGITVQTSTPSIGTCTASGASTTCELGALASGATASVTMQGTATAAGAQNWSSTVSTTGVVDLVAGNNTALLTTAVNEPPPPPKRGGGGGRFDWLALALLGGILLSKSRPRVSARR